MVFVLELIFRIFPLFRFDGVLKVSESFFYFI